MNILDSILKKFIEVPSNLDEITNKQIIEVDEFGKVNSTNNLVIGHVLTCIDHPNSDHLHITTVDVGTEVLQIVCGAANVAAGQYVIVALTGAVLPGNFEIKKATVRGVESNGMICSLHELGFDDKYIPEKFAKGIYHFDYEIKPGTNALEVLGLEGNKLVLGMTTNRGDLLSHLGFAYDLASLTNKKVTIPKPKYTTINQKNDIKVAIETDGAYKYDAAVLEVTVKDSPWWLKNALIESDIRPINNVVDITNYILITYGTPLHAFDYSKVNAKEIVVRNAKDGEKVITLDEIERTLTSEDVVITNGKEAIAVAGVMGLENTVIDENTTKMILEAALFDPKRIQKTSKRLGLKSDSSLRFERGIEQDRVRIGMEAAIDLLVELADAKVYEGISSVEHLKPLNPFIETSVETLNKKLGLALSKSEVIEYFKRLNYEVKDGSKLAFKAPEYRKDILIEADLVEELARIYGYDNIINQRLSLANLGGLTYKQKMVRKLRHLLAHNGLHEAINYSLVDRDELDEFKSIGDKVELLMPMSEDRVVLRQSLIPGLVRNISYHHARQMNDVSFFEIGKVFAKGVEYEHLAIALDGKLVDSTYLNNDLVANYYVLKGLLDLIGNNLGFKFDVKKTSDINALHPGIQGEIYVGNQAVGYIGKLHPTYEQKNDVKDIFVLELDLSILDKTYQPVVFESISKFPSITRDLSFIISKEHAISDVLALIYQTARKLITKIELFDVYQGDKVEAGFQSLAVSITFNNKEKTLEKEDVEKAMKSIKNRLGFTFKAVVRD
ncbi:phenylalanine--tRNA ligase subunit beta [Acholeplasma hippikon]|uniref:Phenylalanine--tRNA ligase beta subunit n=1 Tax=Acholeplasma hippikon TaxID=264636 RepID=A0A449BK59_9MOLU|nr:phenylalanine--tRNA ligase subunit beta [Acholeplasma hippikon]VEU82838.1 tRNA-binding domain-containing protein [Acholeplasma hippikon]